MNDHGMSKLAAFLGQPKVSAQVKLASAMSDHSIEELEAILRAEGMSKTAEEKTEKKPKYFDPDAGAKTDTQRAERYSDAGAILGLTFGHHGYKSGLTGYGAGRLLHRVIHGKTTGKTLEKKSSALPTRLFIQAHQAGVKLAQTEKLAAIKSLVTHWEITPEGDTVEGLNDVVQYLIGKGPMPQDTQPKLKHSSIKTSAGSLATGLIGAGMGAIEGASTAEKGKRLRNAAIGAGVGGALGVGAPHLGKLKHSSIKTAAGLGDIAKRGLQAAGNAVPHALNAGVKGIGHVMGNTSTRNAAIGAGAGAAMGAASGASNPNGSMLGGALKGGLAGGAAGMGAKSGLKAMGGMQNSAGGFIRAAMPARG